MNIAEFNYIEAAVWFVIAIALSVCAYRQGVGGIYFKTLTVASISFITFGVSDIIEAQTGAWWNPLSLLALKAVCVASFAGCYCNYLKVKRAKT